MLEKSGVSLKIVTGSSNVPLVDEMVSWAHANGKDEVLKLDALIQRFADSEVWVELKDNVRGQDVFVVQSTSCPANDNLVELLIIIDALRRSSARTITAVIPYFGYARQDRKTAARTPVSAKLVANLLSVSGVDRIITMDLHAGQIQAFFDIPCDNLYAAPVLGMDIQKQFSHIGGGITIVSPDVGGVVRARALADMLDAGLAIVNKRRSQPGVIADMEIIGSVDGQVCILLDDICDTAGTLVKASDLLRKNGATSIHAYVSHGVFSGEAVSRIASSNIESVVVTDSIRLDDRIINIDKIRKVSIAPLLTQAIINVGNNASISSLFKEEQVRSLYADCNA